MANGNNQVQVGINIQVQADAKDLDRLIRGLNKSLGILNDIQKQGDRSMGGLSKGLASASAQGYYLGATLERAGHQSLAFAKAFGAATFGSFATLMHEASNLEQFIIRLQSTQGTTKRDALDIFNTTIKATANLPITEAQLVRIATTFKQRGMDIRENFRGQTYQDILKSGHAIEGLADGLADASKQGYGLLDIFSDLATTQGQLGTEDIGKFVREFSEFMATGQTRFLRTRLDPALLHELNNTKANAGKAIDVIYEYLAKRNAVGVSRLSMQTFSGIITNFKGLPQRIANAVFQPGVSEGLAAKFARELGKAFQVINLYFDEATEQGKRFLPELRKVFEFIGTIAIGAVRGLTKAFTALADFMTRNPAFAQFAAMAGMVVSGIMALKGVFFLFQGSLATIASAAGLVSGMMSMLNLQTIIGVAKFGAMAAIGTIVFAMFRKMATVISAVVEALESYDPTTGLFSISDDLYGQLQESGLLGLFEKLFEFVIKIKKVFEEGLDIEKAFPVLGQLGKFLRSLADGFNVLIDLLLTSEKDLYKVKDGMGLTGSTADTLTFKIGKAAEKGAQFVETVGKMLPNALAEAVLGFANLIQMVDHTIQNVLRGAAAMYAIGAAIAAFNGNFLVAAKLGAQAAAAYVALDQYQKLGQRDDKGELSILQTMRERADLIVQRGLTTTAPERGGFAKLDELSTYEFITDPATGETMARRMGGAPASAGGGGYTAYNQDYSTLQSRSKPLELNQNVVLNIDGKALAKYISSQKIKDADRAGGTGVSSPMSTPANASFTPIYPTPDGGLPTP